MNKIEPDLGDIALFSEGFGGLSGQGSGIAEATNYYGCRIWKRETCAWHGSSDERTGSFRQSLVNTGVSPGRKSYGLSFLLSGQPDPWFPSLRGNPIRMRTDRITILSAITVAAFGILFSPLANAQAYKVESQEPEFDDLQSPEFGGGKQKSFKPKDWLEIEAAFTLKMSPEPPSKTAERILVKWYVAVKHPEKKGAYLLLTKDVTYVNVPLNQEIFTSVYLSPASVTRVTGSDRGGKNAVELVGYEVIVNGKTEGAETNKSKVGWWNTPSDKISRSDTVPLLNKAETPFANMWWDRYAEILVERR